MSCLLSCSQSRKKLQVKKPLENISLYTDLEGNSVSLNSYKGKRILLNYWATWCLPCLKELPSLAKAKEILKNENYVFLLATTDDIEKIDHFKNKNNFNFKFLKVTSTLDKLHIYALPVTIIFNTSGKKVMRIDGVTKWDSEEILTQLRAVK